MDKRDEKLFRSVKWYLTAVSGALTTGFILVLES